MSMSDEEAVAAIRAHHTELQSDLRERVTALEESIRRGEWHGDAQRALEANRLLGVPPSRRSPPRPLYSSRFDLPFDLLR